MKNRLIVIFCAAISGCQSAQRADFHSLTDQKLKAVTGPVSVSNESLPQLVEKGFTLVGVLDLERKTKRCVHRTPRQCSDYDFDNRQVDELKRLAATKGGQVISEVRDYEVSYSEYISECVRYINKKTSTSSGKEVTIKHCAQSRWLLVKTQAVNYQALVWRKKGVGQGPAEPVEKLALNLQKKLEQVTLGKCLKLPPSKRKEWLKARLEARVVDTYLYDIFETASGFTGGGFFASYLAGKYKEDALARSKRWQQQCQ